MGLFDFLKGKEQAAPAALFARMEDGWEDHQIFMRMTYQVDPGK